MRPLEVGRRLRRRRRRVIAQAAIGALASALLIIVLIQSTDMDSWQGAALGVFVVTYLLYLAHGIGSLLRNLGAPPGYRHELRLDASGARLRAGAAPDVTTTHIPWDDVHAVALAHLETPDVAAMEGMDAVIFFRHSDPDHDGQKKARTSATNTWVAGPSERADVRRVIAWVTRYRPEIPIRERSL